MEHRVQSIDVSLTTVEPVNTWDFKAQVGPTVEAVPYHFTHARVAISGEEVEDKPAHNSRNMTNHNTILLYGHTVLVVAIVWLIL